MSGTAVCADGVGPVVETASEMRLSAVVVSRNRLGGGEISRTLMAVYVERFKTIVDQSQNCYGIDTAPFTCKLSVEERRREQRNVAVGE